LEGVVGLLVVLVFYECGEADLVHAFLEKFAALVGLSCLLRQSAWFFADSCLLLLALLMGNYGFCDLVWSC
jgi:hypothetical protein